MRATHTKFYRISILLFSIMGLYTYRRIRPISLVFLYRKGTLLQRYILMCQIDVGQIGQLKDAFIEIMKRFLWLNLISMEMMKVHYNRFMLKGIQSL